MRGVAKQMTSKNAQKWRQYRFTDNKRGMERLITLSTYCIDSVIKGVAYAADQEEFAIIRSEGFVVCSIDEMPALAKELLPILREEVLEIYQDLKDLDLMEVIYA